MLTLTVGATDIFDEETGSFGTHGGTELQLEHSLVSLSKWESVYERPFLSKDSKTSEELLAYVKFMCLSDNIAPEVFEELSKDNLVAINDYVAAKRTATWFSEQPGSPRTNEIITSELIYYWLTVFKIPFECERWHLNRLFTLIRVCNLKQGKPKKMSRGEVARRNQEINARRKAQLGTSG